MYRRMKNTLEHQGPKLVRGERSRRSTMLTLREPQAHCPNEAPRGTMAGRRRHGPHAANGHLRCTIPSTPSLANGGAGGVRRELRRTRHLRYRAQPRAPSLELGMLVASLALMHWRVKFATARARDRQFPERGPGANLRGAGRDLDDSLDPHVRGPRGIGVVEARATRRLARTGPFPHLGRASGWRAPRNEAMTGRAWKALRSNHRSL